MDLWKCWRESVRMGDIKEVWERDRDGDRMGSLCKLSSREYLLGLWLQKENGIPA